MGTPAKLGIIAGSGRLPAQLVENCQNTGRDFFVLAFEESADIEAIRQVPHAVVRIGAIGEALEHLKRVDARELVMAGKVKRPSIFSLKPDAVAKKLLARMGGALFSGDDALLKTIVTFLEEEGFRVVGSEDILGGLLTPHGVLGKYRPDTCAQKDIMLAFNAARELGARDEGQAAIADGGQILGLEDGEGTDALIERCSKERTSGKGGVLVKAKKPAQEERVDLPAVGPSTIQHLHDAGFAGVAVEADASLILDKDKTVALADALGIFIVGVRDEQ